MSSDDKGLKLRFKYNHSEAVFYSAPTNTTISSYSPKKFMLPVFAARSQAKSLYILFEHTSLGEPLSETTRAASVYRNESNEKRLRN